MILRDKKILQLIQYNSKDLLKLMSVDFGVRTSLSNTFRMGMTMANWVYNFQLYQIFARDDNDFHFIEVMGELLSNIVSSIKEVIIGKEVIIQYDDLGIDINEFAKSEPFVFTLILLYKASN
jgi:hypothetical protein